MMREIEAACGLPFTHIVNNSNLASETTPETLLDSLDYMAKLSQISGLPLLAHTVMESVADKLPALSEPVIPLRLQEKYFDLPSQKPLNRPLWG